MEKWDGRGRGVWGWVWMCVWVGGGAVEEGVGVRLWVFLLSAVGCSSVFKGEFTLPRGETKIMFVPYRKRWLLTVRICSKDEKAFFLGPDPFSDGLMCRKTISKGTKYAFLAVFQPAHKAPLKRGQLAKETKFATVVQNSGQSAYCIQIPETI